MIVAEDGDQREDADSQHNGELLGRSVGVTGEIAFEQNPVLRELCYVNSEMPAMPAAPASMHSGAFSRCDAPKA